MDNQVSKLTPRQKLDAAIREYCEIEYGGKNIIVHDYVAAIYIEQMTAEVTGEGQYFYLTSAPRSSRHTLRGLAHTLSDYLYRNA